MFEEDVGWDLEKYIGDEEHSKACIVLCACQLQVFLEAEDGCIGDVRAVQLSTFARLLYSSKRARPYRSKNANKYMMLKKGTTRRSIL